MGIIPHRQDNMQQPIYLVCEGGLVAVQHTCVKQHDFVGSQGKNAVSQSGYYLPI